jgi:hypothetical protein
MCHPSAGILPGDPHGGARLREYAVLRGLVLAASGGIALAPLSRCLPRPS